MFLFQKQLLESLLQKQGDLCKLTPVTVKKQKQVTRLKTTFFSSLWRPHLAKMTTTYQCILKIFWNIWNQADELDEITHESNKLRETRSYLHLETGAGYELLHEICCLTHCHRVFDFLFWFSIHFPSCKRKKPVVK